MSTATAHGSWTAGAGKPKTARRSRRSTAAARRHARNRGREHRRSRRISGVASAWWRHLQRDHADREAGGEDHVGRLRVGVDVELGRRGHVSQADGTAHEHDLLDPAARCAAARRSAVATLVSGPVGHHRQAARCCSSTVDHEVHRVCRSPAPRPARAHRPVQPGSTVDRPPPARLADQRSVQPAATGTSRMPAECAHWRALSVIFSTRLSCRPRW